MDDESVDEQLVKLLDKVGPEKILEYRDLTFDHDIIEICADFYSLDNVLAWIDKTKFLRWLSRQRQVSPSKTPSVPVTPRKLFNSALNTIPSTPSTPAHVSATSRRSIPHQPQGSSSKTATPAFTPKTPFGSSKASGRPSTSSTPVPHATPHRSVAPREHSVTLSKTRIICKAEVSDSLRLPAPDFSAPSEVINISDDEDFPTRLTSPVPAPSKSRKRMRSPSPIELSDSDDVITIAVAKPKRARKNGDDEKIHITRQTTVNKLVTLTTAPSCWDIPRPGGDTFAYLLDLSDDDGNWIDSRAGSLMSIATFIKSEDQDAWGGGSAGSKSKLTKVLAFGDKPVECRAADHTCQGIYHCDQLDMSLLGGLRYEADDGDKLQLLEAERTVHERTSMEAAVITFYNQIHAKQCEHGRDGPDQAEGCKGVPVVRPLRKTNFDGKNYFIGCSAWKSSDEPCSHRFDTIPYQLNERLVLQLFQNNGRLTSVTESKVTMAGKCAHVLPPRNGAKGEGRCPYPHADETGHPIEGEMIPRRCTARIRIWYPSDLSDRRAIVLLSGAHNHPAPLSRKVSRKGKEVYREAARTVGNVGLTVLKCDQAPSTKKVLEGQLPWEVDPALANSRHRRKIIRDVKHEKAPSGTGLEGVLHRYKSDCANLPAEQQYIHGIHTSGGVDIVVTLLPALAQLYHDATASFHDNTYKRVSGDWKEWEVVIWHRRLNMRITIARIYCENETRAAFRQMWISLWDAVEKATGQPVRFKFIHGSGLRAILVDGCKPQIEACGDALIQRNVAYRDSFITDNDPQSIVQYIVKTCVVHLDRCFTDMASHCPREVMEYVRQVPHIKTQDELDQFTMYCENSPYKKLRDWYADKKPHPWFVPSVNRHFSKMSEEDWYETPNETNINESAHTLTNAYTGIRLSLLDAINTACEADKTMATKVLQAEGHGILPNHRNTDAHRVKANRARKEGRLRKAAGRIKAIETLDEIDEQINELRQQKKTLQQTNRVHKSNKSSSSKAAIDAENLADAHARSIEFVPGSATLSTEPDVDDDNPFLGGEHELSGNFSGASSAPAALPDNLQVAGSDIAENEDVHTSIDCVDNDTTVLGADATPRSPFQPRQWSLAQILQMTPTSAAKRFGPPRKASSRTPHAPNVAPSSSVMPSMSNTYVATPVSAPSQTYDDFFCSLHTRGD